MYSGMSARLDQMDPFEQMESQADKLQVVLSDFSLINYKREKLSHLFLVSCQVQIVNGYRESVEIMHGQWKYKKTLEEYGQFDDRSLINYRPILKPTESYVYELEFETQVPTGLLQGFYQVRVGKKHLRLKTREFQYALPFMIN